MVQQGIGRCSYVFYEFFFVFSGNVFVVVLNHLLYLVKQILDNPVASAYGNDVIFAPEDFYFFKPDKFVCFVQIGEV